MQNCWQPRGHCQSGHNRDGVFLHLRAGAQFLSPVQRSDRKYSPSIASPSAKPRRWRRRGCKIFRPREAGEEDHPQLAQRAKGGGGGLGIEVNLTADAPTHALRACTSPLARGRVSAAIAIGAVEREERVLHERRRQVVLGHLGERLEDFEMVPAERGPEYQVGFDRRTAGHRQAISDTMTVSSSPSANRAHVQSRAR